MGQLARVQVARQARILPPHFGHFVVHSVFDIFKPGYYHLTLDSVKYTVSIIFLGQDTANSRLYCLNTFSIVDLVVDIM